MMLTSNMVGTLNSFHCSEFEERRKSLVAMLSHVTPLPDSIDHDARVFTLIYGHSDKRLCLKCLSLVYAVSVKTIVRAISRVRGGDMSAAHGRQGLIENETLVNTFVLALDVLATSAASFLPYQVQKGRVLPHMSWYEVKEELEVQLGQDISDRSFARVRLDPRVQDVAIQRHIQFARCDTCQTKRNKLRKCKNPVLKKQLEHDLAVHLCMQRAHRNYFYHHNVKAQYVS